MAAAGLDPNAVLQALIQFDNATLSAIIAQLLQSKPELAPGIVNVAIPDLTYAPTKALTERRCSGIVKKLNSQFGIGLIECPELSQVFGCDVIVEKNQVQHVTEGQHVNFAVTLNSENKPQAFDLVDYALAMASAPKAVPGFGGWGAGAGGMEAWGKGGGAGGAGDMSAMMMQMQMMGADPMAAQQIACGGGDKGKGKGKGNQVILGEFLGVIKSYNLEKGFGFIACDALKDQVEGDVYLHQKHVGDFKVGHEVKFQAYLHNGRLQGRDLQDATGMVGPQAGSSGKGGGGGGMMGGGGGMMGGGGKGEPPQDLGMFIGKIKSYNVEKGYGFIMCDALKMQGYQGDVFLHNKNLNGFKVGDDVMFLGYLHMGTRLQARDLQPAAAAGGFAAMGGMAMEEPDLKRARML